MAELKKFWIERNVVEFKGNDAIRVDWDNDRHQRIEISGGSPKDVIQALGFAVRLLKSELNAGEI